MSSINPIGTHCRVGSTDQAADLGPHLAEVALRNSGTLSRHAAAMSLSSTMPDEIRLRSMTQQIVSAYLSNPDNQSLSEDEVDDLVVSVYDALAGCATRTGRTQ